MPAKCFDIDSHPVARANGGNFRADLLDDAYHFMSDRDAGHGTRTLPCLMCKSLVQMLPSVTRTMASRGL